MKRILILIVVTTVSILYGRGRAVAQLPPFEPNTVLQADQLNAMRNQINANTGALDPTPGMLQVDCGVGQTIAQALQEAKPGDTIQITGTCHETVTITTDQVTLDGQGTTTIDGSGSGQAVMTVDGARRVTIKNMTVRNGNDGILARRGAAVILEGLAAEDNANEGLEIDENSTAQIIDCTVQRNGGDGIFVNRSSSVTFEGTNVSNGNADDGISITSNSTAHIQSSGSFTVNNNAENGAQVVLSSTLNLSLGSTLTVQNNDDTGLLVFEASHAELLGTTTISENSGGGISISNNAGADLAGNLQVVNNTGTGVNVTRNSRVAIVFFSGSSPNINNNSSTGVMADYSFIGISSSTIAGNGADDLLLKLGTRAELFGVTFDTIVCDATVLLTGDSGVACPTP